MPRQEISRRKLLTSIGVGSVALGIGTLGRGMMNEELPQSTIPHYSHNQFSLEHDIHPLNREHLDTQNADPLFRGATVSFTEDSLPFGRAALLDTGEELILKTVEHVATVAKNSINSKIQIDGVGITPVIPDRFVIGTKRENEYEAPAYYIFGKNNQELIHEAITEGKITPLTLSVNKPRPGEHVVVPREETRMYVLFEFSNYHTETNLIELIGHTSESCMGDSGAPILQINNLTNSEEILPTGIFYGNLEGGIVEGENDYCATTIFARPNN